jgi:prolyl-tRNA editing enzyme YbaK/EbsC (Cys-tRNA(Pro) deacylase)
MSQSVLEKIRNHLHTAGITFRELEHEPTRTSEESAAVRGEPLGVGAKAMLLKTEKVFRLFVLPADRKLNSTAIRRHFGASKMRFATVEELNDLIGLVPGCVPPFGEPILPFELYADESVGVEHDRVAFNAGSLSHSIIMSASDWEALARPVRFRFSKEPVRSPRQTVEAWVKAFNAADVELISSLYSKDAINHQVVQQPVEGREAIQAMFQHEFEAADMTCIVENIFTDGDWAILEWRDPLGLRGCGFFNVKNGLICFQRGYWDRLSFLRQHNLPIPHE